MLISDQRRMRPINRATTRAHNMGAMSFPRANKAPSLDRERSITRIGECPLSQRDAPPAVFIGILRYSVTPRVAGFCAKRIREGNREDWRVASDSKRIVEQSRGKS